MPKLKTKRGAAKRFKLTKSGKIRRAKAGKSHLLTNKSSKAKRHLRGSAGVTAQYAKKIKEMCPYL